MRTKEPPPAPPIPFLRCSSLSSSWTQRSKDERATEGRLRGAANSRLVAYLYADLKLINRARRRRSAVSDNVRPSRWPQIDQAAPLAAIY